VSAPRAHQKILLSSNLFELYLYYQFNYENSKGAKGEIITLLPALNSVRKLVWNTQIIVVLPAKTEAENGVKSTNNHFSSRHKHKQKLVWNPQIIVVLPAINSVRKLVWNPQIIIVLPAIKSVRKLVWNPLIIVVLPAINISGKWFEIRK
jgi:hypothetical protein